MYIYIYYTHVYIYIYILYTYVYIYIYYIHICIYIYYTHMYIYIYIYYIYITLVMEVIIPVNTVSWAITDRKPPNHHGLWHLHVLDQLLRLRWVLHNHSTTRWCHQDSQVGANTLWWTNILPWKITFFNMNGKITTISTGPFSIANC